MWERVFGLWKKQRFDTSQAPYAAEDVGHLWNLRSVDWLGQMHRGFRGPGLECVYSSKADRPGPELVVEKNKTKQNTHNSKQGLK